MKLAKKIFTFILIVIGLIILGIGDLFGILKEGVNYFF